MKITEKENMLLRRALDLASSANEAETAMAAFARSLRKRGISGYDFVPPERTARPAGPQARPSDAPPPEPPKAEPPPPYQQAYEQAERVYKEASEPEPTQGPPPPPPQPESRFGRWLYRIAFLVLAQQRYAKSHRILANCRGVKDFRRFRNSGLGQLILYPMVEPRNLLGNYDKLPIPRGVFAQRLEGHLQRCLGPNNCLSNANG